MEPEQRLILSPTFKRAWALWSAQQPSPRNTRATVPTPLDGTATHYRHQSGPDDDRGEHDYLSPRRGTPEHRRFRYFNGWVCGNGEPHRECCDAKRELHDHPHRADDRQRGDRDGVDQHSTVAASIKAGAGGNLKQSTPTSNNRVIAGAAAAFGCIFLLGIPGFRKKRWPMLTALLLLGALSAGMGCGGGGLRRLSGWDLYGDGHRDGQHEYRDYRLDELHRDDPVSGETEGRKKGRG